MDRTDAHHVVPLKIYYTVFALLLFCTYLTVQIAYFDLGVLNTVAALGIATFKATMVVLFFMHVKYSKPLTGLVVAGSLLWLGILLAITMADYLTRSWRTFG